VKPPGAGAGTKTKTTTTRSKTAGRAWFVYIVRCADDSLYTGIARDVAARIAKHESGKGARYTRGRAPLSLLAKIPCDGQSEALRIEAHVKAMPRVRKLALARQAKRSAKRVRISLLQGLRRVASCYIVEGGSRS
jgi:putative endonuclease